MKLQLEIGPELKCLCLSILKVFTDHRSTLEKLRSASRELKEDAKELNDAVKEQKNEST